MLHTTVVLDKRVLLELHSHSSTSYPEECCGLLIGGFESSSRKLVKKSKRMTNVLQEKERCQRYAVDPMKYNEVENEAISLGEEVVGIYHSHPNAPATPSIFDRSQAWPSLSYIIIEQRDSTPIDTKSWILRGDRKRFLQEEMEMRDGN